MAAEAESFQVYQNYNVHRLTISENVSPKIGNIGLHSIAAFRHQMLTHPISRPTPQEETKTHRLGLNAEITLYRCNRQVRKSVWHQHGIRT